LLVLRDIRQPNFTPSVVAQMRISPQTETSSKARTLLFLISIALLFGIPTLT